MTDKPLDVPVDEDSIEVFHRVTGKFGNVGQDAQGEEDYFDRLAKATPSDFPEERGEVEADLALDAEPGIVKRKSPGLIEKFMRWADPLNHPVEPESSEDPANWPKKLHIGFMTEVKKKDLLRYIGEWVIDNAESKTACFYQIIPWSGGFAYEVQEGGAGFGVLKSALEILTEQGEVTLPANDRNVQLVRKPGGFATYMPNELETQEISANLLFRDALKPVYSRHHGLMVAGVIAALFGVVAFLGTWFAVYSLYDKGMVPVYAKSTYELPWEQLKKVDDVLQKPGVYLNKLTYQNAAWKLEETKVSQDQMPTPAMPQAVPLSSQALPQTGALGAQLAFPPGTGVARTEDSKKILSDLEKTITESKK